MPEALFFGFENYAYVLPKNGLLLAIFILETVLMEVPLDTYWTVKETAEYVRLSIPTIRRYTMNKEIPFHKINRAVRFKKTELDEWVEKREQKPEETHSAKLFDETPTDSLIEATHE